MSRGTVELDNEQAGKLAGELAHRRVSMGYRSARSLARETGLDYRTITGLESGTPRSVDRNTLVTLEIGLNWPAGTIDRMINHSNVTIKEVTLLVSDDISTDIVDRAKGVAQAAFDAYINQSKVD
jgi:hypothetical protein